MRARTKREIVRDIERSRREGRRLWEAVIVRNPVALVLRNARAACGNLRRCTGTRLHNIHAHIQSRFYQYLLGAFSLGAVVGFFRPRLTRGRK